MKAEKNTSLPVAKPTGKKTWTTPTIVILDQQNIGGGPVASSIEGHLTIVIGVLTYHS